MMSFHQTIRKLPMLFRLQHYVVYRSSYDSWNMVFDVAWSNGSEMPDTMMEIIGKFKVRTNIPLGTIRSHILDGVEDVLRSKKLIQEEMPVYITWNGYGFSDISLAFGRRI